MTDMVEFKVKESDGRSWEMTGVTWQYTCENTQQARHAAKTMSEYFGGSEVRWNWEGSSLGHYVSA